MCTFLRSSVFKSRTINKLQLQITCGLTTKIIPKYENEQQEKQLKEFEKITKIQPRIRNKKPQKEAFVKNLCLGVFDTDILTYPEAIEKEDWIQLNKDLKPVETYMTSEIDVSKIQGKIPKDHLENLASLNTLALQASSMLGGRELNTTENLKVNEVLATKTSSIGVVNNNYFGLNAIIKFGTSLQQANYLQKLRDGNTVSALCLQESNNTDSNNLQTIATLSKDGKTWVLNGVKVNVVNGESADIFIVFATTDKFNEKVLNASKLSVFIVDRSSSGIISKSHKTAGLDNTDLSEITFNNVEVPTENILGEVHQGEKVLANLLTDMRLSTGPICITLTKNLTNKFIDYCKFSGTQDRNLYKTDIASSKIAECIFSLYAMESVTYLTSSLIDIYENQDCEMEAAITKVFNAERCLKAASTCTEFIGMPAYMTDHWCHKYQQNALAHVLFNETNDNLKLTIALIGLQYAGTKISNNIKMMRNPLLFPTYNFKQMWTHRRQNADRPKLNLYLHEHLHPSLGTAAELLEYCVLRLQFVTECMLAKYGQDVISKHMELRRLAECIIDIYVGTAVLGRASRSYCIGLQNAEFEITIAIAFMFEVKEKTQKRILEIINSPYVTNDTNYKTIAKKTFESGKYYFEHPLEKNY